MGRLPSDNPTDVTIRIRTHRSIQDRLRRVAEANKRGPGKEALVAIEKYLIEEERKLGFSLMPAEGELRVAEESSQSARKPKAKKLR